MHTLEQLKSGALRGITRLSLSEDLSDFPPEIYDLADTLEILDLSRNQLSALPDDLPRLHRLQAVFASKNQFTELPPVLGRCPNLTQIGARENRIRSIAPEALPPNLRWLTLTDNALEALPDAIGSCANLQKLMLAGNRLRALPEAMRDCKHLELLRIAANEFNEMPAFLFDLPRLSWLAYAGNPFVPDFDPVTAAHIDWRDLTLKEVLGEGASGVIYRATLYDETVAVKRFKGAVTSDGLPHSEMTACLRAGSHPNLIGMRGQVTGVPDEGEALVMDLIDPAFTVLAGPPSLSSCTRDVYAPELTFTPTEAHDIAHGMASVMQHLNARGINHGDLYAHNILHDGKGHALLGDFGAAAFVPPAYAEGLQRIEVRALGCLLEELAGLSNDGPLRALSEACLNADPATRPLLADICATLAQY